MSGCQIKRFCKSEEVFEICENFIVRLHADTTSL